MTKKFTPFFVVFFTLFSFILSAQENLVEGKVIDENGIPMIGATIQIKGTNKGTTTDYDGMYSIDAPQGSTLVFSFVGYITQEVPVTDSTIDVTLAQDQNALGEVVVTAFGIERETRSLGYSVTKVEADEVNLTGNTNPVQGLQGRVAGVQISQSSGTAGGGIDILIRGITSINPQRGNQPLIVIDGLAMDNSTFAGDVRPSAGSNSPSSSEQFSFTNRAADLNPEDIESFNVLKGAAATALYGVRAANGAIVITTKKGTQGKARVNISASTSFKDITQTPELQTTFREGFGGEPRTLYTPETETGFTRLGGTSFYSWGPRYSDDSFTQEDGTVIDLTNDRFYDPYDLFRTGILTQVDASVSGATEKLNYYFSVGNDSEEGVLPNTYYDKTNIRMKAGYKITDNFNINSSITYANSGGARGNGGDKSVFSSLSYYSATFPINDYINPDGTQRNYSFGIIDNPRYLLEKSPLIDNVDRWIGNVSLNWNPKDWMNITYSAQVDNYSDRRNRFVPPDLDVGSQVGGFVLEQYNDFLGLESNLLVNFNTELTDNLKTSLTLGNQISDSKRDYSFIRGENLNVPGINDISNTINIFGNKTEDQIRNVGVFGELKFDYNNELFLTLTGRNDWVSTLPKENRSFFYPSVSLAYDFHNLIDDDEDLLTFSKIRASWAEVGKGPLFGQVGSYFVADSNFPFAGTGGYRSDITVGDPLLLPEKNRSFEVGADLRFFDNRLRFDYAYYRTTVNNQIFTVGTAYSTGLAGIVRNAGKFRSWGHELLVSYDILDNDNLSWETYLNFATNTGEVVALPDDIEALIFADSGFAGVTSEIRDGDELGSLYGYTWRYENGQRYIDENGLPVINLDERVKVGNAFPDFIASLGNRVNFKGFNLDFLFEWKEGGDLYDSGRRNSIRNGILESTVFRYQTTVLDGVMDDGSGGFTPNTQEVLIDESYYRSSTAYNRAAEILIQDASWVKLRNLSLGYNFGGSILNAIKADSFSVSASVQNILIWTPYDGYDPEGNQYSAGSNVYGFAGLSTPLSEIYSIGFKLGF
ncbi:SusC/RagA family TonB-linked outer membrane protein [Gramella jeungdoensis]|uniref:SusC/RagA family TonB-linked outer membrane protein n=1 Tax=Gramella jeungdoensis TaxID=708091 RepID=A0ABT0Z5Q2_9FLAO|nr:SusC/RagA family TonB-linked outer membrane protein [Gramella jeungdoensis]MCM8570540.1 SusC/RagA family TonB-linked outer membrane protein [Gramella jeungdoensis]